VRELDGRRSHNSIEGAFVPASAKLLLLLCLVTCKIHCWGVLKDIHNKVTLALFPNRCILHQNTASFSHNLDV
jgi:hypothetical protein